MTVCVCVHLLTTNETCTPVWFEKESCQVQYLNIYVRQHRIILSLSQEPYILHANLELCFPSKGHDSRWSPPQNRAKLCVFSLH